MQDPRILSGIIASAWNISSSLETLSREIPVLFQYFVKSTLVDNRGTFGDHEPDAFQRGHAPLAVWQAEDGGGGATWQDRSGFALCHWLQWPVIDEPAVMAQAQQGRAKAALERNQARGRAVGLLGELYLCAATNCSAAPR